MMPSSYTGRVRYIPGPNRNLFPLASEKCSPTSFGKSDGSLVPVSNNSGLSFNPTGKFSKCKSQDEIHRTTTPLIYDSGVGRSWEDTQYLSFSHFETKQQEKLLENLPKEELEDRSLEWLSALSTNSDTEKADCEWSPIRKIRAQYFKYQYSDSENHIQDWRKVLNDCKSRISNTTFVNNTSRENTNSTSPEFTEELQKRQLNTKRKNISKLPPSEILLKNTDNKCLNNAFERLNLKGENRDSKQDNRRVSSKKTKIRHVEYGAKKSTKQQKYKINDELAEVGSYEDFLFHMLRKKKRLKHIYNRRIEDVHDYENFKNGIRATEGHKLLGLNYSLLISGNFSSKS